MKSPFLTVNDVADYLGASVKWVYKNKERIPGYFKINGLIRFDRELLVQGLKEKATKPTVSRSPMDRHGLL